MNVNNHIHTTFSFSPYSPAEAVIRAKESGLSTCGIMDHDTLAGAGEFMYEARKMNIFSTCGLEARVKLDGEFKTRLINNPDQKGIAYIAMHGVSRSRLSDVTDAFAPYREKRNQRNVKMCEKLSALTGGYGINLSFENDVLPLSEYWRGGTVTERHICYAFGKKLIARCGKGENLIKLLKKLHNEIPEKLIAYLMDESNPHYEYDLLGIIKGNLACKFYIPADDECMTIDEFVALAKNNGAIVAYAYLGDVTESVTGDKKAQKFEDDYIEELFEYLKDKKVDAVTYMPSRNNGFQLQKMHALCKSYDFFEICGEDINSSRQKFVCDEMSKSEHQHLVDATFALIGHELAVTEDLDAGMFSPKAIEQYPNLTDRIEHFKKMCI